MHFDFTIDTFWLGYICGVLVGFVSYHLTAILVKRSR